MVELKRRADHNKPGGKAVRAGTLSRKAIKGGDQLGGGQSLIVDPLTKGGGTKKTARKRRRKLTKKKNNSQKGGLMGSAYALTGGYSEAAWHRRAIKGAVSARPLSAASNYSQALATEPHVRALAGYYALGRVAKNHVAHLAAERQLGKALGEGKLGEQLGHYLANPRVQEAAGTLAASLSDILADAANKATPQLIAAANKLGAAAANTAEMDGVIILTAIPPFDELAAGGELVDIVNKDIVRGERIATDGAQAVGKAEDVVEAKQAQFHRAVGNLEGAVNAVRAA